MSLKQVKRLQLKQYSWQVGLAGLILVSLACGGGRGLQQKNNTGVSPQPASPIAITPPPASAADQQIEAWEKSLDQLEKAIDEAGTPEAVE